MEYINFKSNQENYRKEYLGLKCNTFRKFDKNDIRFEILRDFELGNINNLTICIKNTKTNEMFQRIVTDVTSYEGFYIISWRAI
jgi:hypothetical protein